MKRLILFCILSIFILPSVTAQDESPIVEIARLGRGTINTIAWRPDGSLFVVGSGDGLWFYNESLETLAHIGTGYISLTKWSPDGEYLAVIAETADSCSVQIWKIDNAVSGELHEEYSGCAGDIAWFDSRLAISRNDGHVQVVDLEETNLIEFRIADEENLPYFAAKIAWSPDGSQIATVFASHLQIWNATTGELDYAFVEPNTIGWDSNFLEWHDDVLRTVCMDWGDVYYATYVCNWSIFEQKIVEEFVDVGGSGGGFAQVESIPEGILYIADTMARSIEPVILDGQSNEDFQMIGSGVAAARHPSEPLFAYGNGEGELFIYNLELDTSLSQARLHMPQVSDIAWHPSDGRLVVSGYGFDYPTTIWQMDENDEFGNAPVEIFEPEVSEEVAWYADGDLLVLSGISDGQTAAVTSGLVLDGNTYEEISLSGGLFQYDPIIRRAYDSQYEQYIDYTSNHEGLVFSNGNVILPQGESISSVVWSPDDSMVTALSYTYVYDSETSVYFLEIWDSQTLQSLYITGDNWIDGLQWSSDNRKLLFIKSSMQETVGNLLDVQSGEITEIALSDDLSYPVASTWHPDSQIFALGYRNNFTIYDAETGESIASFPLYQLKALDWSQDGQYIAAGGADGIVRIFDVSRIVSNN